MESPKTTFVWLFPYFRSFHFGTYPGTVSLPCTLLLLATNRVNESLTLIHKMDPQKYQTNNGTASQQVVVVVVMVVISVQCFKVEAKDERWPPLFCVPFLHPPLWTRIIDNGGFNTDLHYSADIWDWLRFLFFVYHVRIILHCHLKSV